MMMMMVVISGYEKYLPTWEKNHTNAMNPSPNTIPSQQTRVRWVA